MEIILLENIDKVGGKFEVVNVRNGYGRNYLIPNKKALIANDTNMRRLKDYQNREARRMQSLLGEFQDIATKLKDITLKIGAKAGASGKIFGSVTNIQLANALKEQANVEIARKTIEIPEVKELGTYTAILNVHPEVEASVKFEVVEE